MIFYKTSTYGNDFIIVDQAGFSGIDSERGSFSKQICDRDNGIGSDGVVFYKTLDKGFGFIIYNSDGSRAEISGNGMAGLSAVLFKIRGTGDELELSTDIGFRNIILKEKDKQGYIQLVDMGIPDFNKKEFFPFLISGKREYLFKGISFVPVSTGNPHAVIFLHKREDRKVLEDLGKIVESGNIFPEKTNVEFVFPIGQRNSHNIPLVEVLFYERGAGITPFSSTGSAAVLAVLYKLGISGSSIFIKTEKESVAITYKKKIFIESYTKIVYKGEYYE